MPDVDPFLSPAAERGPRPRLAWLQPWIVLAIALLLMLSVVAIGLVRGRQDPSLTIPADAFGQPSVPVPQPTD